MHAGWLRYVLGATTRIVHCSDHCGGLFRGLAAGRTTNRAGLFDTRVLCTNYAPGGCFGKPGTDRMDSGTRAAWPRLRQSDADPAPERRGRVSRKSPEEHGFTPSFEEIGRALNVASKSNSIACSMP